MTSGTNFKLINILHTENANLPHKDLNTSINEAENRWNIHLVSYDTITSRAKPSSNSQLSHHSWSCGIIDESPHYKTRHSVGWQIAMNARIRLKLQATATVGFHSLYDSYIQTIWLFPGAPEVPEDETVMEEHGAEAQYSAMKSLMYAIKTGEHDSECDAAQWIIQIAKPWRIGRWSESKLANGKPPVWIPNENAHLFDVEWTKEEQAELKTLVQRNTSQGPSGVWRVHISWLACSSLVLGDTEDRKDVSGQW